MTGTITELVGRIIGIFFILFIGYTAAKIKWISPDSMKTLNKILLNIASPCLIIHIMTTFDIPEGTWELTGWILGILIIIYIVSTLIGWLFSKQFRVPYEERGIYMYSLTYTNNGFLGLPIGAAIFGAASQGFFLMVLGNLFTVMITFSFGILTVAQNHTPKRSLKETLKPMLNIPICSGLLGIALMLLNMNVDFPEAANQIFNVFDGVLEMVGDMMIPLSMLIVGAQLAGSRPRDVLFEKRYYWLTFLRLIAMPGILYLLLTWLHVPPMATFILVLTVALPSAALVVIFAQEYGKNTKSAAEIVFITTLFSLITLPLALIFFLSPLISP
ncbi:MAG: AEC family transporter [Peptococcaceae bacterium]|nr:AEC family transporter [Peptococcaceae bacterium]